MFFLEYYKTVNTKYSILIKEAWINYKLIAEQSLTWGLKDKINGVKEINLRLP